MDRRKTMLLQEIEEILDHAGGGSKHVGLMLLFRSRQFLAEYGGLARAELLKEDGLLQKLGAVACRDGCHKKERREIISLVSPHQTYQQTMMLFGCTRHECKEANMLARIRDVPINPLRVFRVCRFPVSTARHLEIFALRSDNVLQQAFSDSEHMRVLRKMSRCRLYVRYTTECGEENITPVSRSEFYKYFSQRLFKDMQRSTCCCGTCTECGDGFFDLMQGLVEELFGEGGVAADDEVFRLYVRDLKALQTFYQNQYKSVLRWSSTDVRRCLQHALTQGSEAACDHADVDTCSPLQAAPALCHDLQVAIEGLSGWKDPEHDKKEALHTLKEARLLFSR
jgi:hypothetical protein